MEKHSKILVAGCRGLVGSSITRKLKTLGFDNLLLPSRNEVDYAVTTTVNDYFDRHRPEYVYLCAAKVGGIQANYRYPAQFIYDNLMIQNNVIHASYLYAVQKLLFLGSSCIYPKLAPQPIQESYLMTGPLEETNRSYAIAKIAGVTMCQSYRDQHGCNFISAMPTNLYGPQDHFDTENSHVLPALIRKFHDALPNQPVVLWGTGNPMREFLYVDDLAEACIFLMDHYNGYDPINVGTGQDIAIRDLALAIQKLVGHTGDIVWNTIKPDGTMRKVLDVSKLDSLGWTSKTTLESGLIKTYDWFKAELGRTT